MRNYKKESLRLHGKLKGKLEISSKIKLKNKNDLSLVYTPGVAEVSRVIGKNKKLTKKYTIKQNTIAIVTDGSAILGLGNLGPEAALPVMEGKAILFKEFANVDAFPICLDTQDTEEIIKTVKYLAPVFGGINLEDISAPRCFEIEQRLKKELDIPVFHDDQHGTAVVILAGLINALKLRGSNKVNVKIAMNGAGAAGTAVAGLLLKYGFKNIIICDSGGIISNQRTGLTPAKKELAKITNKDNIVGNLSNAIKKTDVFIGVSAPNLLTEKMIKSMNPKPIIFAMANPNPEIMPDKAKRAGAFIIATGRSDFPNQVNNVLAFPGIFRGALDKNVRDINDKMLIRAAEALAGYTSKLSVNNILPSPLDKNVSNIIAKVI
ncbi:MAG: NADP-dependent malic enzyme [Patescibacteria group bacterium]|jgi:malate dehydrogenase (oxaloacetate-decarboxylating)